jgi:flagellar basal-body rod protein FlgC
MYGTLDVSTSGLVAQRVRLEVISANIANATTILDEDGNYAPYQKRFVEFAPGDPVTGASTGVHVASIGLSDAPPQLRYEPESPWANAEGYVGYPAVDPVTEQMNALEALRAYEANVAVAEATKSMMSVALQMIA